MLKWFLIAVLVSPTWCSVVPSSSASSASSSSVHRKDISSVKTAGKSITDAFNAMGSSVKDCYDTMRNTIGRSATARMASPTCADECFAFPKLAVQMQNDALTYIRNKLGNNGNCNGECYAPDNMANVFESLEASFLQEMLAPHTGVVDVPDDEDEDEDYSAASDEPDAADEPDGSQMGSDDEDSPIDIMSQLINDFLKDRSTAEQDALLQNVCDE